jgi:predicted Zn-dependent protease
MPLSKPSLRYVEHTLIGASRDFELEAVAAAIAKALLQVDPRDAEGGGGECAAHAELAARMRLRGLTGDWEGTREMVELAAGLPDPPLWALRLLQAHARAKGDDRAILHATNLLIERMNRPAEAAALLVRAGEAAARLGEIEQACDLLDRAAMEDPGDVVTWGLLADARQRRGDTRGAAEACEALARTSVVAEHQLLAWYDAGRMWLDDVKDPDRAVIALEQAAAIDIGFQDTFQRLSELYVARHAQVELAALLERRLAKVTDSGERHDMEVERGRVLLEVGDHAGARKAFEAALADRPDDPAALGLFAELCAKEKDWTEAEQAWVRLARLLPSPAEQRGVYERLGELYAVHLLNLSRAEVAYSEVLKRAPDDVATMERLVDVYKRQNHAVRAVELQQELVARSSTPEQKRIRIIELANIYDTAAHETRKAEQTLEAARRESPQDVQLLRALVDFYARHKQTPAIGILLDRAAADARRAIASGRLGPVSFENMEAVFELRGRKDAARVAAATHAAFEGRSWDSPPAGGDARALDARLDDIVAPDILTPALRNLLAKTGDALDAAAPFNVRDMSKLPPRHDLAESTIHRLAAAMGLPAVTTYVSTQLGRVCIPVSSSPPTLAVGQGLLQLEADPARTFLVARALKLVQARASALVRVAPAELAVLVGAWLQAFNPSWKPQGVSAAALTDTGRRLASSLPRGLGPELGVVALEVAGSLGTQAPALAPTTLAWASRTALLAVGDPSAALEAIAMSTGAPDGVPEEPAARAAWILRTPEAKDLLAFSMSDAYADARARLGLDR